MRTSTCVCSVLDEVFGEATTVALSLLYENEQHAGSFAGGTTLLAATSDYVLWYAKDIESAKYRQLYLEKEIGGAGARRYTSVEEQNGKRQACNEAELDLGEAEGRFVRPSPLTSRQFRGEANRV